MLLYYIIALLRLTSAVLCELLNKYEGDTCQWRNATGMCVHVYKCPRGLLYLKQKDRPPICSFMGKEPIICCTDCQLVEDNRKIIVNPDLGLLHLTGQKAHDQCVKFIDKLDYGCKEKRQSDIDINSLDPKKNCRPTSPKTSPYYSYQDQFKYIAIMGYGRDLDTAQWACAGTIISEKFILTAAFCLENELGTVSFVSVNISSNLIKPWEKYRVKRSIPHPEYQQGSNYNDIGLVETQNTIIFSKDVLPACLQTDPELNDVFLSAIVRWEPDGKDDIVLQRGSVIYFDDFKCSYFYPPLNFLMDGFNETTQICYGDGLPPEDSCVSDIGSPLIVYSELIEDCADIIQGVMAIERTCGELDSSGLFTKVIHYVPWIESIVWP